MFSLWRNPTLRGVNLGGGLVLEKWITPSLFTYTSAEDEQTFHTLGLTEKVLHHYKNFIIEDDFIFLEKIGINAVRIPVGYWIFGDYPPFPASIDFLDSAFKWAEKYHIKVLIDLHAVPGSQNGYDHSGIIGQINWHKNSNYIFQTLSVLESLSDRYKDKTNLWGISLVNEPHRDIPLSLIEEFYVVGYETVRKHCNENIAVVISDAFRPLEIACVMKKYNFKNLVLDSHFYQAFNENNEQLRINEVITNTKKEWSHLISEVRKSMPLICGEWSLGINQNTVAGLKENEAYLAFREFGRIQIKIFNKTKGWFFWTYKTEEKGGWNFKDNALAGVLSPHSI
jgi:glucan 1,3-beta-glucosidase